MFRAFLGLAEERSGGRLYRLELCGAPAALKRRFFEYAAANRPFSGCALCGLKFVRAALFKPAIYAVSALRRAVYALRRPDKTVPAEKGVIFFKGGGILCRISFARRVLRVFFAVLLRVVASVLSRRAAQRLQKFKQCKFIRGFVLLLLKFH